MPPEPAAERLPSGGRAALAAAVEDHADALYRAARGLALAPADAEDLVQETFATFLEKAASFEGRSSVRTFLFGILYNKARQRWQRAWREEPADPVDQVFESRFDAAGTLRRLEGPEEVALNDELAALIGECSAALPASQAAAFHLKEVERLESGQICKILDVSETNLGVLLFRARNKLRECLERKWRS